MNRYYIEHTDAPLQVRLLPEQPPLTRSHNFDLEESWFHKLLVTLESLTQTSPFVFIVVVAALDYLSPNWIGSTAIALVCAQLCDAWVLRQLAPRRISFGPLMPQWLELVALRLVVALACSLVPLVIVAPIAAFDRIFFFHINWLAVAAQLVGIALVVYGFRIEPATLGLSRVTLRVPSFARGSEVKLLHVTDAHLERHGTREDQLLALTRAVKPDAILFTGDFLNLSNVQDQVAQKQAHDLWRQVCAIAPVYAVTGSPPVDPPAVVTKIVNGFRWGDPTTALPTGIVWLRDEVRDIYVNGNVVRLIGTACTHNPLVDGEALRQVAGGREQGAGGTAQSDAKPFTILLHHSPDLAPQAAALDVIDMQLAGHTHGGQVRLPQFGALVTASLYYKALEMGLYELKAMLLFVSRGVGFEGKGAPRVRLACPPEVMLLTLRGEASGR